MNGYAFHLRDKCRGKVLYIVVFPEGKKIVELSLYETLFPSSASSHVCMGALPRPSDALTALGITASEIASRCTQWSSIVTDYGLLLKKRKFLKTMYILRLRLRHSRLWSRLTKSIRRNGSAWLDRKPERRGPIRRLGRQEKWGGRRWSKWGEQTLKSGRMLSAYERRKRGMDCRRE